MKEQLRAYLHAQLDRAIDRLNFTEEDITRDAEFAELKLRKLIDAGHDEVNSRKDLEYCVSLSYFGEPGEEGSYFYNEFCNLDGWYWKYDPKSQSGTETIYELAYIYPDREDEPEEPTRRMYMVPSYRPGSYRDSRVEALFKGIAQAELMLQDKQKKLAHFIVTQEIAYDEAKDSTTFQNIHGTICQADDGSWYVDDIFEEIEKEGEFDHTGE